MKLYNKTLWDLQYKVELSRLGACTACFAAPYHGTRDLATAAVAKHRAISNEVRSNVAALLTHLDHYDAEVEAKHQALLRQTLKES